MNSKSIDLKDMLERARIFVSEKLYDDAKKTLHKILISNPNAHEASALLEEVRREELKNILSSAEKSKPPNDAEDSVESILKKLDSDFDINFTTTIDENNVLKIVKKIIPQLSAKEKIDLGIAFLTMEFHQCAIELFSTSARHEKNAIEATYLWAQTLLEIRETSQAVALLEPFLQDLSLPQNDKLDFLYLAAQAFELMGETQKSKEYFKKVKHLNPKYRDVASRIK